MRRPTYLLSVALLMLAACGGSPSPAAQAEKTDSLAVQSAPDAAKADPLEARIAQMNADMPINTGGGIVIERVEVDASSVSYVCTVDESQGASLDDILSHTDVIRAMLMETLDEQSLSDPAFRSFLRLVVEADKNLCYSYRSKSTGQQFDILIGTSDLRPMI